MKLLPVFVFHQGHADKPTYVEFTWETIDLAL